MKKFLSTIFCLTMVFSLSATAFATETNPKTVTNEFEAMLLLNEMSTSELTTRGYNADEINTIRNATTIYDEHMELLATIPDENLSAAGYTPTQIQGIKAFDPETATDSTRAALSAECITTSTIDSYTGTTGRVTSEFYWDGVPAFKMTDILVAIWNNWEPQGRSANIKYTHLYGSEPSYWRPPTYKDPDGDMTSFGGGFSYPAALQDNYFYASEGFSIFVLKSKSPQHLETTARVSHQQGIASPTFAISGMDLGFTIGRMSLGEGHDLAS